MWFKCSTCGHEWQTPVNNRTSIGKQGCPICARKKVGMEHSKKVMCIETGVVYESISDAVKQTNIRKISACCNEHQKTAGGYHWKFI